MNIFDCLCFICRPLYMSPRWWPSRGWNTERNINGRWYFITASGIRWIKYCVSKWPVKNNGKILISLFLSIVHVVPLSPFLLPNSFLSRPIPLSNSPSLVSPYQKDAMLDFLQCDRNWRHFVKFSPHGQPLNWLVQLSIILDAKPNHEFFLWVWKFLTQTCMILGFRR